MDQIQNGKPFSTKSGMIEFYNPYYETFDLSKIFVHDDTIMRGWSEGAPQNPMATFMNMEEGFFDPNVSTYPLVMSGMHQKHTMQTQGLMNPRIYNEITQPVVWISVADAKSRNINDGDMVTVYNDRGSVQVPAYVTSRIVPGMVWMWRGETNINASGTDTGGCDNMLAGDDINVQPSGEDTSNALVEVKKS